MEEALAEKVSLAHTARGLKELLVFLQDQGIRRPELMSKYGHVLVTKHASSLGNEVWLWIERVLQAALDCHNAAIAEDCLATLKKKFPESKRVKMLEARILEEKESYEEANKIYDLILKEDSSDANAMKGKVNLAKAKGDIKLAIKELTEYSQIYSGDKEAWQELADLYVAQAKYELAKFCVEELILLAPENYANYCQYAELLYQMGGKENLDLSLDYFAQSLELKPEGNLRALYGLAMTLQAHGKASLAKTYAEVFEKIILLYKDKQPALVETVRVSLDASIAHLEQRTAAAPIVKTEGNVD